MADHPLRSTKDHRLVSLLNFQLPNPIKAYFVAINLYYNKSISFDREIILIPQDSTFFNSYLNEKSILNSNKLCETIKNINYINNITSKIVCSSNLGLNDLMEIIYIDIKSMISSYQNTKSKTDKEFNKFLMNYNLTQAIDITELYINKALLTSHAYQLI